MRRLIARRFLPIAAAMVMLLSACSDGDETAAGEGADGYVSPINEFLGGESFGFGGDLSDDEQARIVEQERAREEQVAQCMREEGFEYIPRDAENSFVFGPEGQDGPQRGTREFAEKYGFGVSTERYSQAEVGPELVGFDEAAFDFGAQEENDPNAAIVEAMDDATRMAYEEALYGPSDQFPEFDPETMTEEELAEAEEAFLQDYEPQGCMNVAFDTGDAAFFRDFSDQLTEMQDAVLDDPRVAEAYDEINSCITEKGFEPVDLETGPWQLYEEELQAVDELVGGGPDIAEELTEADFEAMSEEELEAMFNQPREFTPEAKTKLGEIQAKEIEHALAAHDCGGNFFEPPPELFEVLAEYEQRFLEDNAEQLEEYKGSLSES